MEKHSVSKIIGSPPGYVGHDEGGYLTELVRHRPYAVVLFDEIEKAHPEVFNILLQVMDNGRLTDAKSRTVNFKNTIVILTSNIGAKYIEKMQKLGFSNTEDGKDEFNYTEIKSKVMENVKDHFSPEFLNRLDEIVLFNVLSASAVEDIVKIQIEQVKERLSQKEIDLELTPEVLRYLAKEGYNPQYGARPLKRLIQSRILNPIAGMMLSREVGKGGTVSVGVKGGELTFDVKKGRRGSLWTANIIDEPKKKAGKN
jgi:ATP-dependent Clp protease ATP-binding subunit ClpC